MDNATPAKHRSRKRRGRRTKDKLKKPSSPQHDLPLLPLLPTKDPLLHPHRSPLSPSLSPPVDNLVLVPRMQPLQPQATDPSSMTTSSSSTTLRSRPKPSPIATISLQRSSSISSTLCSTSPSAIPKEQSLDTHSRQGSDMTDMDKSLESDLDEDHQNTQGGRDSGIAIESWDPTQRLGDSSREFPPCSDQGSSLEPGPGLLDPFQGPGSRRRRCQSMIQPQTPACFSALCFRSDEETPSPDRPLHGTRTKRVASLSNSHGLEAQGLPPRPPLAPPSMGRSSFFHSPSSPDTSLDGSKFNHGPDQGQPSRNHLRRGHSRQSASFSSTRSSSASSASAIDISLSPSSPPPAVMPFSSMMDLATAKAENITGLYFARQMCLTSPPTPVSNPVHPPAQAALGRQEEPTTPTHGNDSDENSHRIPIKLKGGLQHPTTATNGPLLKDSCSVGHTQQPSHPARMPSPVSFLDLPPLPPTAMECQKLGHQENAVAGKKRPRTVTNTGLDNFSFLPIPPPDTLQGSRLRLNLAPLTTAPSDAKMSNSCPALKPSSPQESNSVPATSSRNQHRRSHSASHYFHLSSLKHHAPGQFNLALCYEHGRGGVDQDLERAIHFYQQAADQGHTKASYNLGCICYNLGYLAKALAWFECAGKSPIRGLQNIEDIKVPLGTSLTKDPPVVCPYPKRAHPGVPGGSSSFSSLDNDLADMLRGPHELNSGPFSAYLPAILCLALLCRQGVQTREGKAVLKRDSQQAVELLQRLVEKAPLSLGTRVKPTQGQERDMTSTSRQSRSSKVRVNTGTRNSNTTVGSSLLSTSCPSLSGTSFCGNPTSPMADPCYDGHRPRDKKMRPSTVEDEDDVDLPRRPTKNPEQTRASISPSSPTTDRFSPATLTSAGALIDPMASSVMPSTLAGGDLHETWAVTLAQHLLRVWTLAPRPSTASSTVDPRPTGMTVDQGKSSRRIIRHHLLYMTNPTHAKNLYNLGVLYDLYLDDVTVAIKCYKAAYHNSGGTAPLSSAQETESRPSGQITGKYKTGLVTRINSAWNLGVLFVKSQEWSSAQEWFQNAQEGIRLYELQSSDRVASVPIDPATETRSIPDVGRMTEALEKLDLDNFKVPPATLSSSTKKSQRSRSLVNVVPSNTGRSFWMKNDPGGDSPGRRLAREHGLTMHIAAPTTTTSLPVLNRMDGAGVKLKKKVGVRVGAKSTLDHPHPTAEDRGQDCEGIRTDATKVAWVLRWVTSNMHSSTSTSC